MIFAKIVKLVNWEELNEDCEELEEQMGREIWSMLTESDANNVRVTILIETEEENL